MCLYHKFPPGESDVHQFGKKSSRTSFQQPGEKQKRKKLILSAHQNPGHLVNLGVGSWHASTKEKVDVIRCLIGRLRELAHLPT